jgi:hypothetical protein
MKIQVIWPTEDRDSVRFGGQIVQLFEQAGFEVRVTVNVAVDDAEGIFITVPPDLDAKGPLANALGAIILNSNRKPFVNKGTPLSGGMTLKIGFK